MAKKNITKRRKKSSNYAFFVLFILFIIIVAIIISCYAFFKVENIQCNEVDLYSTEEIIEASGANIGDNLLFLDTESIEERIFEEFSYIETVKVVKKIPFTLSIEVTIAEEYYCVEYNEQYVLVSQYGRLLALSDKIKSGCTLLKVGEISDVDGFLYIEDEEVSSAFSSLVLAMTSMEKGIITEIDLSDPDNITLLYDERIVLELGDSSSLSAKIQFGIQILASGEISDDEIGVLNLSLCVDTNKAYFSKTIITEENQESTQTEVLEPDDTDEESSSETESSSSSDSTRGDDIPDV